MRSMRVSRALARSSAQQQVRQCRPRRPLSSQSSSATSTSPSSGSTHSHSTTALYGGLAGGGAALFGVYAWYHFSGAKSFVNTAHETKAYFNSIKEQAAKSTPEPNEALSWLRNQALFYSGFVPGARRYVETTFDDLDTIHDKHRDEVDKIVSDAYKELKGLSEKGVSADTASQAWALLQKYLQRIADLAGDSIQDILKNHPELKEKVGGNIDQLKSMGKNVGPEAQKVVDDTWSQIQKIIQGGIGIGTIDQIRKLIQEKTEQVKQVGDQAWQKGLEGVKPYLDKSPQVKEIIEKNKDALKSSNLSQLWEKVRQAADSGDTGELKGFLDESVKRAKQATGGGDGLDKYLNMIPGGSDIFSKLQQLSKISQEHGREAEKLFKDTLKEVQDVLKKKVDEGKKLADKAAQDSKKA